MIKNRFIVSGILVDCNYKLLLCANSNTDLSAGKFVLPTANLDENFTPEESLVNVIRLRTGLACSISNARPLIFISHNYPTYSLIELVYLITGWDSSNIKSNNFFWVNASDIHDHLDNDFYNDLISYIVPLIRNLGSNN